MGARQSKLKKELEALKQQVTLAKTKHDAEVEALKSDKRVLEFKLNVLQELTAQAQLEAEKANQVALESEERMKALKWELVRKLTVSTSSSTSTASGRSSATSLAACESSTPRVALNWKLRDGVTLRRSSSSLLPTGSGDSKSSAVQRSHAQSEPAMPHKQALTKSEPTKLKAPGPKAELSDARSDTKAEEVAKPTRSSKAPYNNNNEEGEPVTTESAANSADSTVLQPMSAPSSTSSSENESRSSKFPAISRKKSTSGPQLAAQGRGDESKQADTGKSHSSSGDSGSEPESGERVTRTATKQGHAAAANRSRQRGDESEGKEDQEGSDSDSRSRDKEDKKRDERDTSGHVLSFSDDEEEGETSS